MNTPLLKKLWLTRHGESQFNTEGRIGGDSKLSCRGERYAKGLCSTILSRSEDNSKTKVWTSNLQRTRLTARHLPFQKTAVKELDEINAGIAEGLTYNDFKKQFPTEDSLRRSDKLRYRYPDGESYVDIANRISPLIQQLKLLGITIPSSQLYTEVPGLSESSIDKENALNNNNNIFQTLHHLNSTSASVFHGVNGECSLVIVAHQAVLRVLYGILTSKCPDSIPRIEIPLHTVIELTPTLNGSLEEQRIFVNVDDSDPLDIGIDHFNAVLHHPGEKHGSDNALEIKDEIPAKTFRSETKVETENLTPYLDYCDLMSTIKDSEVKNLDSDENSLQNYCEESSSSDCCSYSSTQNSSQSSTAYNVNNQCFSSARPMHIPRKRSVVRSVSISLSSSRFLSCSTSSASSSTLLYVSPPSTSSMLADVAASDTTSMDSDSCGSEPLPQPLNDGFADSTGQDNSKKSIDLLVIGKDMKGTEGGRGVGGAAKGGNIRYYYGGRRYRERWGLRLSKGLCAMSSILMS
mmetsp:Transcript_8764/g.16612  ORF Transcript_8764/g.16612 Transcript_8764/m.16612 type:complete len:520 (-) Transcript_8764:1270-2829(-)|eukprot:CAMPEP_0175052024 /NCGR_PEP_ID=MMETSP0052_2-20121109/8133_1 /TAXON_ID=51329 ORGANISM="Polytomella parva, Strain SAG 63-3" /NCGR_SAMPLE_ID=MMETSP0052_2 /ASSEMBLY_ACC=CAM_ASM_000194 /LENGTH=519 /DNA_ID=CAMNT_0016316389 /DNA_START=1 /DNA_END=1560 /DNA_ORIENTATION=+